MGRTEVQRLFARIGSSAATIQAVAREEQYRAIGEFGIGVLSYFLVCKSFELYTIRHANDPIGLEFSRDMLDGRSQARSIESRQTVEGTELVLSVEQEAHFNQLLDKFSHWMRDVEGLSAKEYPSGKEVSQGGLSREIKPVEISTPEWIHETAIGPPVLLDSWDKFDGSAMWTFSTAASSSTRCRFPVCGRLKVRYTLIRNTSDQSSIGKALSATP